MQHVLIAILITIPSLALLYCFWMLYRNEKTCQFRGKIIDLVHNGRGDYFKKDELYLKYTYDETLKIAAFHPLKLETFFTEEEIKILTA